MAVTQRSLGRGRLVTLHAPFYLSEVNVSDGHSSALYGLAAILDQ